MCVPRGDRVWDVKERVKPHLKYTHTTITHTPTNTLAFLVKSRGWVSAEEESGTPRAKSVALCGLIERLIMLNTSSDIDRSYRPLRPYPEHPRDTHTALSHLHKRNTYVTMLFIDYSSAFNTIVPTKLITKLRTLGRNTSLCSWNLDLLTGRPQMVRVGNNTSATLILITEAPQGCVLSPLMYSVHPRLRGQA